MSSILSPESLALFPLTTILDLETFFKLECIQKAEPNLALLSIVLGAIEHSLIHLDYSVERNSDSAVASTVISAIEDDHSARVTSRVSKRKSKGRRKSGHQKSKVDFKQARNAKQQLEKIEKHELKVGGLNKPNDGVVNGNYVKTNGAVINESVIEDDTKLIKDNRGDFPGLELDEVESLFLTFKEILVSLVDLNEYKVSEGTPKELVKKVSDIIWSYLSRSYKADMPHLSSLYSYLLGRKLDSFGVALTVTAGCQILGLKDVHLALSEDHAWVVFGSEGQHTSEVTWHGKGVEDKRGQPVRLGDDENSWLYLKGWNCNCTRHMEAAAIVASINFNINSNMNSSELLNIEQKLLWQLHDAGHLAKYPMALSCLAELEEINPTPNRKSCATLFQEAVLSNQTCYNDMHIYPYTNYAGYFFRQHDYKSALKHWADAARIIQKYNRSKNDEEIYREFLEISVDYLTNVMKNSSTGFSAHSIIRDPCCFAQLLRFFDGICMWEETSRSPIVHIIWAKAWVSAIGKFDYTIRRLVQITLGTINVEEKENAAKLHADLSPGNLNDNDKGSGKQDDEVLTPAVTLYSEKMQQLKDLLKLEKYNPSNMTLLLTAQSAATSSSATNKPVLDVGNVVGRSRRERLSQNLEIPKNGIMDTPSDKSPPRKRVKLETPAVGN